MNVRQKQWSVLALIVVMSIGMHVGAHAASGEDANLLPEPTGPYPIGTFRDIWTDTSRQELTTSDPADKRRVFVQVWYPAVETADAVYAPYAEDVDLYQPDVGVMLGSSASRRTHGMVNAPVSASAERFPVLLYNAGGGAQVFLGTVQAEFLASHGFVVIGLAHSEDSQLARFSADEPYVADAMKPMMTMDESRKNGLSHAEYYQWLVEYYVDMHRWQIEDSSFVLDHMVQLNRDVDSQFFRRLDLDRVGALGWSRGGATAFQLTLDDARVKAAVNLDGSLFGRSIEREGSDRPLLFIESAGATDSIVESYVDPAELQTLFGIEASVWEMFSRSSEDWYRAKITGVDHGSFSDLPFVVANPSDQPPATSAERAHEIINALLLEFFGKYLNDSDETPLLSDQASWPELHIAKDVATKPF